MKVKDINKFLVKQMPNEFNSAFVVGVNGAQGSGKTTLSLKLQNDLQSKYNKKVVALSLDDFYKTRVEREKMARDIHPLFMTRGVPGTHDVDLAIEVISALKKSDANSAIAIPRFNKATDDRLNKNEWPIVAGKIDVVIFEGWCLGVKPQDNKELIVAVNELEENEDANGVWRNRVNEVLGKEYQKLFALIDFFIMLKIPSFDLVFAQRLQQERELRAKEVRAGRIMDATEINRFIMYFQRLTEHMYKTMSADLVLNVDSEHNIY